MTESGQQGEKSGCRYCVSWKTDKKKRFSTRLLLIIKVQHEANARRVKLKHVTLEKAHDWPKWAGNKNIYNVKNHVMKHSQIRACINNLNSYYRSFESVMTAIFNDETGCDKKNHSILTLKLSHDQKKEESNLCKSRLKLYPKKKHLLGWLFLAF